MNVLFEALHSEFALSFVLFRNIYVQIKNCNLQLQL